MFRMVKQNVRYFSLKRIIYVETNRRCLLWRVLDANDNTPYICTYKYKAYYHLHLEHVWKCMLINMLFVMLDFKNKI